MPLPTIKTPPTLDLTNSKLWLYGAPGVGKTTLATSLDPDHTILLATEPGYGGIEAFVNPIGSWKDFLDTGSDLANETHEFKVAVVDTIDQLSRQCQDHVMKEAGIAHPSDLEYGKGWGMVGDEFKLRIGRLCSLGMAVIFISHEKDSEIKKKVGTVNKAVPKLGGAPSDFIEGFVDYILRAEIEITEEGERRIVRTSPSENWMAKQRGGPLLRPLPEVLPMEGAALREALESRVIGQPEASAEPDADAPPQEEKLPLEAAA